MKDTLIWIFIVSEMTSICQICPFLKNNIPAFVVYQCLFVSQLICHIITSVLLAILNKGHIAWEEINEIK